MTQEHLFPRWLIDYAPARKDNIRWLDGKRVAAEKATIPLCTDCNAALGRELEGPVAEIFRAIDADEGLSDHDCELLVRWLWKFEGLQWLLNYVGNPNANYSQNYNLVERVTTSPPFDEVRSDMVLAVSRIKSNDEGFEDWPLGLDMPPSELSAMCMSGVFGRIALICSLAAFAELIPEEFGIYRFKDAALEAPGQKLFFPPTGFEKATDAIVATVAASVPLLELHERFARSQQDQPGGLLRVRPRVELPPV